MSMAVRGAVQRIVFGQIAFDYLGAAIQQRAKAVLGGRANEEANARA